MGQTNVKQSITENSKNKDEDKLNIPVNHIPASIRLQQNIDTYANPERLLYKLVELTESFITTHIEPCNGLYLETDTDENNNLNLKSIKKQSEYFKKTIKKTIKNILTQNYEQIDKFAYDRDIAIEPTTSSKLINLYENEPTTMGAIFKYISSFKQKSDFHEALEYLMNNGKNQMFDNENVKTYFKLHSICKGDNHIYISALNMSKHWITLFLDNYKDTVFDDNIMIRCKNILRLILPELRFTNINETMNTHIYKTDTYINCFGSTKIYFYIKKTNYDTKMKYSKMKYNNIDSNTQYQINYDVIMPYFDNDETLYKKRMEFNESCQIDLTLFDPSYNKNIPKPSNNISSCIMSWQAHP